MKKVCARCNIEKPITFFNKNMMEHQGYCKKCQNIYQKEYKKKHINKNCELNQGVYNDGTKVLCTKRSRYICPYCERTFCADCYEFLRFRCMCTPVLLRIDKYRSLSTDK